MVTLHRLKYYGKTLEEYQSCKEMRENINYTVIKSISISGIIILGLLTALSFATEMIAPFRYLYLSSTIGMLIIAFFIRRGSFSYTVLAYLQMLLLYLFSTGLSLVFPGERGTVGVIIMPLLSAVIIDRADRLTVFNTLYTIIYCFAMIAFKDPRLVGYEIFSIIISLILATLAHYFVQTNIINGMLSELKNRQLIAELNTVQGKLRLKSETDGLTGLLNREAFVNRVQKALRQEGQGISALCIIDLDAFKSVNDTYGHQQGDRVLIAVSDLLKKGFRSSDMVGRVGGDEFMIFLQGLPGKEQIKQRIRRIHGSLNSTSVNALDSIRCSIGIALLPQREIDFDDLYFQADKALYTAKKNGRNRICFFDGNTQP